MRPVAFLLINKSLPASAVIMKSLGSWTCTARAKNGNHIGTPATKLDQLTNGWKGNQLIVLAARPGQGKNTIGYHLP